MPVKLWINLSRKILKNNYLAEYENYLITEVTESNYTLDSYLKIINKLATYAREDKKSLVELTTSDLKIFISDFYDLDYAKKSISKIISTIKSYYNFLEYKKYIKVNPSINLVYPKREKRLPNFLFHEQIVKIFSAIDYDNFIGARNYLIIITLYSTGVRVSELVNIRHEDINLNSYEIIVVGKGNKERIVPINDYFVGAYKNYRRYLNKSEEYVFLNSKKQRITERGIRYILNDVVKKSGAKQSISPHMLRHSFATELLNAGMDIRMVQELLGHENITSTQVYTHVSKNKIKAAYNQAMLRDE